MFWWDGAEPGVYGGRAAGWDREKVERGGKLALCFYSTSCCLFVDVLLNCKEFKDLKIICCIKGY